MHMSDALLSPAVGATFWMATAGLLALSARRLGSSKGEAPAARMGIMGAFIFASQMINFTIPGTGSSGHLGGGLILAIVLGPWAAFITMATVLLVQALFFADGGLLALGANVFNLGFFTCFLAYPLVFKPLARDFQNRNRVFLASVVAAVAGLQLGAFGVVLETVFSGISSLPFTTFVVLMQPIHLAIGVVEGLVTAGVVLYLVQAAPETLIAAKRNQTASRGRVWAMIAGCAVLVGGVASWFASQRPDGLEWSIGRVTGKEELEISPAGTHEWIAKLQEKIAFLPDYTFHKSEAKASAVETSAATVPTEGEAWPNVDAGRSVSGIVGGLIVCAFTLAWALLLRLSRRARSLEAA